MNDSRKQMRNALIWIVIYVVAMSVGESLNASIGMESAATAAIAALLTAGLCIYLSRCKGWGKYGFESKEKMSFSKTLYCLPLILLLTVNLWRGAVLRFTVLETALHILSMLCVGFIEETLFRGLLFRAMLEDSAPNANKDKTVKSAVLISSLTFGLGHIVNLLNGAELLPTLLQLVYAVAIGFALSVFVLKTGNIIPCVAFHGLFNASSAFSNEVGMTDTYSIVISVIITVVALGYAAYLWFGARKTAEVKA